MTTALYVALTTEGIAHCTHRFGFYSSTETKKYDASPEGDSGCGKLLSESAHGNPNVMFLKICKLKENAR